MQRIGFSALAVALVCACSTGDNAFGPNEAPSSVRGGQSDELTRVDLGTLGGPSSVAADVNDRDDVVGWSTTASGAIHAFRWSEGTGMIDLGTLPGHVESRAVAILDHETPEGWLILGVSRGENDVGDTPVVWSRSGAITALSIPLLQTYEFGSPVDFNARGEVVGWDAAGFGQHAWIWSSQDGKFDLSADAITGSVEGAASMITDKGVVVFTTTAPKTCAFPITQCWRSFLWSRDRGFVPLGTPGGVTGVDVSANGLNDRGSVVGLFQTVDSPVTPYRWSATGGFTSLARLSTGPNPFGYATAVNDAGQAVGAEHDESVGFIVAALWPAEGGVIRLDRDAPSQGIAEAINSHGTVAGQASVSGSSHAVIWTKTKVMSASRLVATATETARLRSLPDRGTQCLTDVSFARSRAARFECLVRAERAR